MSRRTLVPALALSLVSASALLGASASAAKWPAWLSVEAPVNPYEPGARGAALLVHAAVASGAVQLSELTGTAEGIVNGGRRTVPLRFDATSRAGVFALQRQWPTEGAWMLRIALRSTTLLVRLDRDGNVAAARVPMRQTPGGTVPRAVAAREIDSTLAEAARQ